MPIVPRSNPQEVHDLALIPGVRNTTEVRAAPLADAGAAIARPLAEHGQRVHDQADVAAFMDAQRQLSDWRNGWEDPNNEKGMLAYKGKEALGLRDAMLPDYDSRVGEIAQGLSPRVREKFLAHATVERDQVWGSVNRYAQAQYDGWLAGERKAYDDTQRDVLVDAQLKDPDRYQRTWAATIETLYADGAAAGMGPKAIEARIAALQSNVHAGVLDRMLVEDPTAAQLYLDEHKDEMLPETVTRALATIAPLRHAQEAEDYAARAFAGAGVDGAPADADAVQEDFQRFAARHGTVVTSGRRPVIAAGAGARSLHPLGLAADFRTKTLTREQGDALIADLKAAGYQVVDERDNQNGLGPHIHAERDGAGALALGPPRNETELIARLDRMGITDPRVRKQAETEALQLWARAKREEAQADADALDALREKVRTAPPGTPLRQALGSGYARAFDKGWVGTLSALSNFRDGGAVAETNPITYDRFARTAAALPAEFAKPQTKLAILKAAPELSTQDLSALLSLHAQMNKPDGKAAADWATREQRIDQGLAQLGFAAERGKPERHEAERGQFRLFYGQALAGFVQRTGKEPTPEQEDALLREVVQRVARNPSLLGKAEKARTLSLGLPLDGAGGKPVQLTAADRRTILADLAAAGITHPTEAEILRYAAAALE